ncbi:MAG TPA: HAMP domain-containing sensor histidine kinase [Vicinamibacterales bacterium]|nr:HAMP domain-containing sensor histidine kinase [Vicinamibacterales bacterium]
MSPDDGPESLRPLAQIAVAAAYVSASGEIIAANDWFHALKSACPSVSDEAVEPFVLPMLFVEEDRAIVRDLLASASLTPGCLSRALTAAGSLAPVIAEFTPIRRRSDERLFWCVTLRPSNEAVAPPLDLSSRSAGTAGLVHDLRAPVQVVLGWASVLRRHAGEMPHLEQALTSIERSAELLDSLLEDLLEQTRPGWSRKPAEQVDVDLVDLVNAEVGLIQPLADARDVTIAVFADSPAACVRGDALQLRRVVMNLIGNAVKFTPPHGVVTCRVWRAGGWAGFAVTDTGPGISGEYLRRVFDPFVQEPGRRFRRTEAVGLGLGLAVVRYLVEQHGGTVTAASPGSGQGTTFTVLLPAAPSTRADSGAETEETTGAGRARRSQGRHSTGRAPAADLASSRRLASRRRNPPAA